MRTVELFLDDQLLTAATMDAPTTVIIVLVSLFYKIINQGSTHALIGREAWLHESM